VVLFLDRINSSERSEMLDMDRMEFGLFFSFC